MTKQAQNLINLCCGNNEGSIRQALQMVNSSVRNEIIEHYGSLNEAITKMKLGIR